jgi:hypothetical protein
MLYYNYWTTMGLNNAPNGANTNIIDMAIVNNLNIHRADCLQEKSHIFISNTSISTSTNKRSNMINRFLEGESYSVIAMLTEQLDDLDMTH